MTETANLHLPLWCLPFVVYGGLCTIAVTVAMVLEAHQWWLLRSLRRGGVKWRK